MVKYFFISMFLSYEGLFFQYVNEYDVYPGF